jgi:Holliday junction resolvase RusA-like endonuclease
MGRRRRKGGFVSQVSIPLRDKLVAQFHLFCPVKPLQRPRINKHTRAIYQPTENQIELLNELALFPVDEFNFPMIVDIYINFDRGDKLAPFPIENRYGDEDNLRKAVCDALQAKKVIINDNLILGGSTYKCFNTTDFTLIKIYSVKKATVSVASEKVAN